MMFLKSVATLVLGGFLLSFQVVACDGCNKDKDQTGVTEKGAPSSFDKMPAKGTKAYCLVMGAEFTVTENTLSSTYKGKTYVFCCPGCKPKFDADPEKYINANKVTS